MIRRLYAPMVSALLAIACGCGTTSAGGADAATVPGLDAGGPADAGATGQDASAPPGADAGAPVPAMPVISRAQPVFASTSSYPASNANDADYQTLWRSVGSAPHWIAVDLSAVPAAQRGRVIVAWYAPWNFNFDRAFFDDTPYNLPADYTVDIHAGAGGGAPPAPGDSGWITAATVQGNDRHSRQHVVELTRSGTSYNWLRLRITAIKGSTGNSDAALQLDVHDAHASTDDDWIFFGDSITAGCWWPGDFAQRIAAERSRNFPVAENGGIGGLRADSPLETNPATGQPWFDGWLASFPGRFVALSYGSNDSNGNRWGQPERDAYYASFAALVQKVLAAGKTPIVPVSIPWSTSEGIQGNEADVRAQLARVRADFPGTLAGPDLWAALQDHPEWLRDGLHPNDEGNAQMQQAWARAMLDGVYAATAP